MRSLKNLLIQLIDLLDLEFVVLLIAFGLFELLFPAEEGDAEVLDE